MGTRHTMDISAGTKKVYTRNKDGVRWTQKGTRESRWVFMLHICVTIITCVCVMRALVERKNGEKIGGRKGKKRAEQREGGKEGGKGRGRERERERKRESGGGGTERKRDILLLNNNNIIITSAHLNADLIAYLKDSTK